MSDDKYEEQYEMEKRDELITKLKSDNAKLVGCVRWYGDPDKWAQVGMDKCYRKKGDAIFYMDPRDERYIAMDCGEKARALLKELEVENE